MNLYETTFIINPQTDDATIDRHVREVADVIQNSQGKIRFEDNMGTRRLAYEIKGLTQGYYASFIFEAPTELLPALEKHYRLNESYIRHLTVRFEGDLEKLIGPTEEVPDKAEEKPTEAPVKPEATTAVAEEEAPALSDTQKIETVEPEVEKTEAEVVEPETPAASEPEKTGDDATEEDQEL